MRFRRLASAVVVCIGSALAAPSVALPADSALYTEMGGKDGLNRISAKLLALVAKDPRTAPQFQNINFDWLQNRLTLYFCEKVGGPCHYPGRNMHDAHVGLHLATREFNALVEDLQIAMNQEQIPFPVQNRFLALFAPLHRDMVTR
jgi:hemoglobin